MTIPKGITIAANKTGRKLTVTKNRRGATKMTEWDMERLLLDELREHEDLERIVTFKHDGVLTTNHGIVVTMVDGSKFQITVVRVGV